jgi:hypothetical protein
MTTHATQLDLGLGVELTGKAVDPPRDVEDIAGIAPIGEPKGVVYTKPWVVNLILDLAGYVPEEDLALRYAVEPAAGEGAFLLVMIRRLLASLEAHDRPLADSKHALHAYELDERSAALVIDLAIKELRQRGADAQTARSIAHGWVTVGDYLLASRSDRKADLVVGNPPYIRYDDLPEGAFAVYRRLHPTMVGRCDIYVGFIEAGLRQLADGGALAFICADRWMRSAYGTELRRVVARTFSMDVVIEMHDAPAFENEVSAYPAVIVIRRAPQGQVIVASAGAKSGVPRDGNTLAESLADLADAQVRDLPGFSATRIERWFEGNSPWPSVEPHQLAVLQRLEERFLPLEDVATGTKVGIGVASGNDSVYITTDPTLVEEDRLLPLAMAADTRSGEMRWSGHHLVDPWQNGKGLVDLSSYPLLQRYFEEHRNDLTRRNIAKRHAQDWYRTIDRVNHRLTTQNKLYFPDMKLVSNPTLDRGETYPHHNLYYLTSEKWDLEVLGGLLLSRVAQLFIEAYCVKMRGGTLRFQAQYLRRIRIPDPSSLSEEINERLREAFRSRDIAAATDAAYDAYGIADARSALTC